MRESLKHQEAFDYYYSLGKDRTYRSVADRFKVGKRAVERWGSEFNWLERIQQRDISNSREVQARTDRVVVNSRADHRKDIRLALQPVKAAINKLVQKNPDTGELELKIEMKTPKDMALAISSLEKLMKLDLVMMEEADSRTDHKVVFILPGDITEDDI
jgi:hypothetical protein